MNEQTAERLTKALESIAESLARLANPPMVIGRDGDPVVLGGCATGQFNHVQPAVILEPKARI